jgi:hypothetical protein
MPALPGRGPACRRALIHEPATLSRIFLRKRNFTVCAQFLRYHSAPEANSVRTERLADTETILYRLGSEFNLNLSNYCGNPVIRSAR